MRLTLTVVAPTSRTSANVVLEAGAETEVGVVADELARIADGSIAPLQAAGAGGTGGGRVLRFPGPRTPGSGAAAGALGGHAAVFVDGRAVDPRLCLAESPL